MVFALALAACTGGEESPSSPVSALDQSWMAEVARDPAAFSAVVDADRDAWIALHRNDWKTALTSTSPAGDRARARLAELHTLLAATESLALRTLDRTWAANGGPPAGSAWPLFGAIGANSGEPPTLPDLHPLAVRRRLHDDVLAGAQPVAELYAALATPVVTEHVGAATREFWDPWAHQTLARWYRDHPTPLADGHEALSGRLFSAWIAPGGTVETELAALGIPPTAPDVDDPQACRDVARALDAQLDAWSTSVAAGLVDDGRALFTDLRLVPVARARVLEALAVRSLAAAPNCALAYGLLAQDHGDSRSINAVNSPTLFAILASAQLATGHTREALDALEPLTAAFPEIHGLDETVGDLAILQGIHRTGDSREN